MREHLVRIPLTLLIMLFTFASFPALSRAQDATEYRRRAKVLRHAVQRCTERIRSQELTRCNVNVGFDVNRTVSMEEAARLADDYERRAQQVEREGEKARCLSVRERYVRDMAAVRRMQKTIQMGQQELEEWTKRNEEAEWAALKSALNLLVDGGLGYLAESTEALNQLKHALEKYERQLKRQGRPVDPLQQAKWLDMNKRILEMEAAMRGAKQLQDKKEKAEIFWGYFTAKTREVDQSMGAFKKSLATVEEDPILHKLLVDKGVMPLVHRLKTKQLFPRKPYLVNFLEFVKDYGYSATEWIASRNRIIQQYEVSDQQLRAVNSMQEELKRTMNALNECVGKGLVTRP